MFSYVINYRVILEIFYLLLCGNIEYLIELIYLILHITFAIHYSVVMLHLT